MNLECSRLHGPQNMKKRPGLKNVTFSYVQFENLRQDSLNDFARLDLVSGQAIFDGYYCTKTSLGIPS